MFVVALRLGPCAVPGFPAERPRYAKFTSVGAFGKLLPCISRLVPGIGYYQATIVVVVMCFRRWSKFTTSQRLGRLTGVAANPPSSLFCVCVRCVGQMAKISTHLGAGDRLAW